MTLADLLQFASEHWRNALEIAILYAGIYYSWLLLRLTRGARILSTAAVFLLSIMLLAYALNLREIGWLFHNISVFLVFALVIIFQPEIRRSLSALGSHRLLSFVTENPEAAEVLADATFDLANRQLGALIAIERDSNLDEFAESGVAVDSQLSQELLVTIFYPKTPLHDGGIIIRNDRIVSAACIFPVSQRSDLDRNLGLRHRAGLGLAEEYDAVVIVVSEETGIISICHRGNIERNFDPESFKKRLRELLLSDEDPKKMSRLLLEHWVAKIVCLALAVTLWLVIKKSLETTGSPSSIEVQAEKPFQFNAAAAPPRAPAAAAARQ